MAKKRWYVKRRALKSATTPEEKAQLDRWFETSWLNSRNHVSHWPLSTVPEIRITQLEVGPGRCPFCETPLKREGLRRPPIVCKDSECVTEYHRAYQSKPSRVQYRREFEAKRYRAMRDANVKAGLTAEGLPRLARWKDRLPL